jgi:lactoylglutathione lyase
MRVSRVREGAKVRGPAATRHSVQSIVPLRSLARGLATEAKRPFRVIGLQQVAIGGLSKDKLRAFWVDIMGLEAVSTYKAASENVDEDILRIGAGSAAVEVDIMQPLDAEKSPKVHVPPLNHIGLWIDDLPAAVEWLTAKKVRFTPGGIRKGASGHNVCFIHPKGNDAFPISSEGVLLELVQAPPEVIKFADSMSSRA